MAEAWTLVLAAVGTVTVLGVGAGILGAWALWRAAAPPQPRSAAAPRRSGPTAGVEDELRGAGLARS